MNGFNEVKFKWQFRDYQQRVLDNADNYLLDGKINIVAAPGSGKTILGLELIRRCNAPCIILSPTTTIKYQWGERFESAFLDAGKNVDNYVSYDLNDIKLLNSITYQALYSAMNKIKVSNEEEEIDYSNIDLFKIIKDKKIKTICLDEAHHLQNEWQKALEQFVKGLDKDIKIISLTATPPYDAKSIEWERYSTVCGEIDEEIFVPELVKQKTLCPHQDYIYFNYPDETELNNFQEYKSKVYTVLNIILNQELLDEVYTKIMNERSNDYDLLFENVKGYVSLLILIQEKGIEVDKKLIKVLTTKKTLPEFNLDFAQEAIQLLLDDKYLLSENQKENLLKLLKEHTVLEKGEVNFSLKEKLKKQLTNSIGKLKSINKIVESETQALKEDLRMLILTDYIKKETLKDVGSSNKLTNISVVSIFESLRRESFNKRIGILSGGLVVLPIDLINQLEKDTKYTQIADTEYATFTIKGSNKEKVAIVSDLFEKGYINILIGTKSLLGEGWDSPCINSLILASFVGSFMLSNQMRGRAIRMYKNNPNKISNIWHLVTLEPEYMFEETNKQRLKSLIGRDKTKIDSSDYETLVRRFDCFVGPSYSEEVITSGIDRISIINPPYDMEGIENINKQMIERSRNREEVKRSWESNLVNNVSLGVSSEVPKEIKVPRFTYVDYVSLALLGLTGVGGGTYISSSGSVDTLEELIVYVLIVMVLLLSIKLIIQLINKLIKMASPKTTIKHLSISILDTLKKMNEINYNTRIHIDEDDYIFSIMLENDTIHEQNIFNKAISELLSPIDNPRYIVVMKKRKKIDYKYSFACPSIIGQNKMYVDILVDELKKKVSSFDAFYTRNADGREVILKCRKKSLITKNDRMINKKKKVRNYE